MKRVATPPPLAISGAHHLMSTSDADHRPSEELLESTHAFPGVYQIKVIGIASNGFEDRVVEAVVAELAAASDLDYSVRTTPGGRHVSLTLEISVQTAEQVRTIYDRLRELDGITLLF
jgi:putative lipoic acid-binding regulatory protein